MYRNFPVRQVLSAIPFLLLMIGIPTVAQPLAVESDSSFARIVRDVLAPGDLLLLADAQSGIVLRGTQHWDTLRLRPGSLAKLALLVALTERDSLPLLRCEDRFRSCDREYPCAVRGGHGWLGLEGAIAQSCNVYFWNLAERMGLERLWSNERRVWPTLPRQAPLPCRLPATAIGLIPEMAMRPDSFLIPLRLLILKEGALGSRIRSGLRDAAEKGTARALRGMDVLAKTGTVPADSASEGWGFCLVAWPSAAPTRMMLVGLRGKSGTRASEAAGRIFATQR